MWLLCNDFSFSNALFLICENNSRKHVKQTASLIEKNRWFQNSNKNFNQNKRILWAAVFGSMTQMVLMEEPHFGQFNLWLHFFSRSKWDVIWNAPYCIRMHFFVIKFFRHQTSWTAISVKSHHFRIILDKETFWQINPHLLRDHPCIT